MHFRHLRSTWSIENQKYCSKCLFILCPDCVGRSKLKENDIRRLDDRGVYTKVQFALFIFFMKEKSNCQCYKITTQVAGTVFSP